MGKLNIGEGQDYGNPGDSIPAKLPDGSVVNAIAATPINNSTVLVAITDDGQPYAFNNPSVLSVPDRELSRSSPSRKPPAIALDYPFKVLVEGTGISVQGFDEDANLANSDGYTAIGLTNTGDGYVAIAQSGDVYLFDIDGEQTTRTLIVADFGSGYIPSFEWTGNATLTTSLIEYTPNLSYSNSDNAIPPGSVESMTTPNYGVSQVWSIKYDTDTASGENWSESNSGLGYITHTYTQNGNNIPISMGQNVFQTPSRVSLINLSGVPTSWDDNGKVFSCDDNTTFAKTSYTELQKSKNANYKYKRFVLSNGDLQSYELNGHTTITGTYERTTNFSSSCNTNWSGNQVNGDYMFLCLKSITSSGSGSGSETGDYSETTTVTGVQPFINDILKKDYYYQKTVSEVTTVTQSSSVQVTNVTQASGAPSIPIPGYNTSGISGWDESRNLTLNITTSYELTEIENFVELFIINSNNILVYKYRNTDKAIEITNIKNTTKTTTIKPDLGTNINGVDTFGNSTMMLTWYRYGVSPFTWSNPRTGIGIGVDPFFSENPNPNNIKQNDLHSLFDIPNLNKTVVTTDNTVKPPVSYVVELSGSSYEIQDDYDDYCGFVFICDHTTLQLGLNTLTISDYRIGLDDENGASNEKNVKKETITYTTNSENVTSSNSTYIYHSQSFYQPSGEVEIYFRNENKTYKAIGAINSFTKNITDGFQTFVTLSLTVTEIIEIDFYCWENVGDYLVVNPINNHTISLIKYILISIKNINCYKEGDTFRIAIAKTVTADNIDGEDEWFADIYEFDTVNKKFIRIGNESGSLSEINGDQYDFISYHPI